MDSCLNRGSSRKLTEGKGDSSTYILQYFEMKRFSSPNSYIPRYHSKDF